MSEFETTRRGLLRLGASLIALLGLPREGRTQALDQGIGGTGVAAPGPEDRDQGIGGTGVIGTIKKFGSIYVNDLRITYPQDAVVRIDGQPGQIEDLKIGQVVHVVAASRDGGYATRMIDVQSEVVGPVQRTADGSLVVLGQTVATDELPQSFAGKVGETVAVSGLRRPDGTIVASLVEPRPGAAPLVAGPVTRAPDGRLQIGGLPLAGLDPASVGQRVSTQVVARGGAYTASRPQSAQRPFGPRVTHLSIEAYVERNGPGLRLGSGFAVGGGRDLDLPAEGTTRAVLNTSVGPDGRAFVTSARAVPHGPGFGGRGPGGRGPGGGGGRGPGGGGGRGPGGGGPGRFGPGGRGPGGFGPGGRGPGGGPGGRMGPGFGPGPRFGGPFGPGGGRRGFGGGPGGGGRGFRGGGGRGFRGGGGRGGGGGRRR